ncbi:MAG: metallophosphoesterase family protein [Deltaproteobacteria bacterium]|nr:metallophosphoesterase family protein [Deltaproteobacteria bacterium]
MQLLAGRPMRSCAWVFVAALALAFAACGGGSGGGDRPDAGTAPPPPPPDDDASAPEDAATPPPPPTRRDAGPGLVSHEYTPAGCGYTVRTPMVQEASMGGDATGESPTPDHVHVSYASTPSSSFAVNWRTEVATTVTRVLYGTTRAEVESAEGATATVREQLGHTLVFDSLLDTAPPTRIHEAHVCGLEAQTPYFYKVGGPGAWSAVHEVATAPVRGATVPFRFAVTGDSRDEMHVWAEVQAAVASHGVDFQLFTGDAVVVGAVQPQWDAWFEATSGEARAADVLAEIPFMPANGNHDSLAVGFLAQFALPQHEYEGERGDGEESYSFDYGNAHVVVLNDFSSDMARTAMEAGAWLREDLRAVDRAVTPWVFVVHHHATYSCSTVHGSNFELREAWQPIFDEHGVDVVFAGHDHTYERSLPIRGFRPGTREGVIVERGADGAPVAGNGTVYVVSGGAGAELYGAGDGCDHTYVTESVRNYVIVEVEGRTLRHTAYRLDGSVLDRFEHTK